MQHAPQSFRLRGVFFYCEDVPSAGTSICGAIMVGAVYGLLSMEGTGGVIRVGGACDVSGGMGLLAFSPGMGGPLRSGAVEPSEALPSPDGTDTSGVGASFSCATGDGTGIVGGGNGAFCDTNGLPVDSGEVGKGGCSGFSGFEAAAGAGAFGCAGGVAGAGGAFSGATGGSA